MGVEFLLNGKIRLNRAFSSRMGSLKIFRNWLAEIYNYFKGNRDPLQKHVLIIFLNCIQRVARKDNFEFILDRRVTNEIFTVTPGKFPLDIERSWQISFHGPLGSKMEFDYFLNTIKMYRKWYPEVGISLCQIRDSLRNEFANELELYRVEVHFIPDPGDGETAVSKNLLRQMNSVTRGIEKAREDEKMYFIKHRVDQRMLNANFLPFMNSLILEFRNPRLLGRARIFGSSLNTYSNRTAGLSDMLQFGDIDTMTEFWPSMSKSEYLSTMGKLRRAFPDAGWSNFDVPEQVLSALFLLKRGEDLNDPWRANEIFWGIHAGITNATDLGHIWARSGDVINANFTSFPWFKGYGPSNLQELHFPDWLIKISPVNDAINIKVMP